MLPENKECLAGPCGLMASEKMENKGSKKEEARESLSVGQLAKRWAVGVDRIRKLIEEGQLPEAFRVPASGVYGEALRIPIKTIQAAEAKWTVEKRSQPRRKKRPNGKAALLNFPEIEFNQSDEHDERSPSNAPD